jgi:hypothetical protein
MCRCIRILPNKNTCNIFLWNNTKIINYLKNNMENIEKNIFYYDYNKKYSIDQIITNQSKSINITYKTHNINIIVDNQNILWFNGNDITTIMGYKNPKLTINNNIDNESKIMLNKIYSGKNNKHPQSIYIDAKGIFSLINNSKIKNIDDFKSWMYEKIMSNKKYYCVKKIKC